MTSEQLTELAGIYLNANTPFYFFDNVRGSQTVAAIAESRDAGSLQSEIGALLAKVTSDESEILSIFAYIAALSLQRSTVSKDYFLSLDLSRFRWGAKFADFASRFSTDFHNEVIVGGKVSESQGVVVVH